VSAARSTNRQLAVLTAAKVVANTALRWVSPFLPVLQTAFATTTGTLTSVMGVAELGGLSTMLTGSVIDRGRERAVFVAGLGAVGLSSLIALGGSVTTFAIAFAVLIVGVTNLTVAAHAWIGNRVPLAERGRGIGVVETSWAIALLVGAPIIAVLIGRFGWRGPFVALAVASVVAAILVVWKVPGAPPRAARVKSDVSRVPLGRAAWASLLVSAATAASGIGIFVVSGVWLDERHGVSTAGLGAIAAGFGIVELGSSSAVAAVGDRIGTRRSIVIGLLVLLAGLGLMVGSGSSRVLALAGLMVFLAGFEFAFVSSLTLVTEAAPEARGRAIGIGNALGTLARSAAVAAGGLAYEAFGIGGSVALSALAAVVALVLILVRAAP
jgi:MFS transporter, DHA1 family, inner membrane transport protein